MTSESDVAPDVSSVIDRLKEIRHETGYDLRRIFRDWMALAVYAFERNDPDYHDRLDRYAEDPHDEETRATVARLFSEALGELAQITIEEQRPVVGEIFEEVGNRNEDNGQFFTPWNTCLAKAEMILSAEDARESTPSDPVTIADPACGSARLLVAAAMTLHEYDASADYLVSGTDADRTCARMAVVNLVLARIPGRIRYGDSLTMDIHEVWHITPDRVGAPIEKPEPPEQPTNDDGDAPEFEQEKLITDGGTGWCWDHEDCPLDDCGGELSQQDQFNVMCLNCKEIWSHVKSGTKHYLQTADFETVAEKPITVADGGTERRQVCRGVAPEGGCENCGRGQCCNCTVYDTTKTGTISSRPEFALHYLCDGCAEAMKNV